MANSDKNIKITPNINQSGQPVMVYTGSGNVPIALKVLDDSYGTLSFEGSAGQLFSLNNNLASGTIFSVNDISGMPQFDVNADGTIRVAPYGSGVYMGGIGGGTFNIQPSPRPASGVGTSIAIKGGNGVTSGAGGSLILQAGIQATSGGDGKVIVRQVVGQTSNLQEWQNSSTGILNCIDSNGTINLYPYGTSSGNTNSIKFLELAANGTNFVGFKAPNAIPSDLTWILPSGDGSTGQALVTNGSGLLSWATASGGGGTGTVTSVSGIGSVNGLTLTGTVTSSGSLTLGGTLSNISLTTAVGGILPIANGGTNLSSIGSANQILGANSGASALEYKTLTPGSGISISNTVGAITINSSGLTANALTIGNGLTSGSFNGSSATTINVNSSGYSNTTTSTTSSYDLGTSSFVKANPSASGLTINGFSSNNSYDGRNIKLVNISNYNITIANTGTNVCVGGNNIILGPKDAAELILDSGASVWRIF
jgi:hypothetical protein